MYIARLFWFKAGKWQLKVLETRFIDARNLENQDSVDIKTHRRK